ncbi:hypothetical protein [uncultured Kordia sp.]|uniref:hypothetical protein n=1 Tax=uncultured Kordia sp. TaxID=507699 RepID=UPI002634CD79|nr:hypothetical protein [uncultured Kordia sp.]
MNIKNIKRISLSMLFISFFYGCDFFITETEKKPKYEEIIAFCDMTTSLDSASIEKLAKDVQKMIKNVPVNTQINIYPINDNTFTDKIFFIPNKNIDESSNKGVLTAQNRRKKYIDSVKNIILTKYKEVNKNAKSEYKSCIISSLETVFDIVKTKKNKENVHVVFFSDMIEQCEISQVGKMYMCSSERNPKKDDLIQQVQEKYTPNFNLKELVDNRITVIISTNLKQQDRCLQEFERKEIWKEVFKKVGYSDKDFTSFHFNQNSRDDWSTLGK